MIIYPFEIDQPNIIVVEFIYLISKKTGDLYEDILFFTDNGLTCDNGSNR